MVKEQVIKLFFTEGYVSTNRILDRIYNFILSLILIVISFPVGLLIYILIRCQDGGPAFYKGIRLGINKKPFIMYKFRTLIPDAEVKIGGKLLPSRNEFETKSGKFLRNTHLDELPQLFNILKGDMDFIGPRPERPAIYEKYCKNIHGYDRRFSVKPGLVGYSQLFTPHGTPKKIRTFLDNSFVMKRQKVLVTCILVLYTILIVIKTVLIKTAVYIWEELIKSKILGIYRQKRTLTRIMAVKAQVHIGIRENGEEIFSDHAELLDINEEAFRFHTNHRIEPNMTFFELEIRNKDRCRKKKIKRKSAKCFGKIYRVSELKNNRYKYFYIIKYTPISPINAYMFDQYFLKKSMV